MSELDFTTARAADGRLLVRWLEARVDMSDACPSVKKQIERWRRGQQVRFWSVDAVLVEFNLLPCEVPTDVWIRYDNGRRRRAA